MRMPSHRIATDELPTISSLLQRSASPVRTSIIRRSLPVHIRIHLPMHRCGVWCSRNQARWQLNLHSFIFCFFSCRVGFLCCTHGPVVFRCFIVHKCILRIILVAAMTSPITLPAWLFRRLSTTSQCPAALDLLSLLRLTLLLPSSTDSSYRSCSRTESCVDLWVYVLQMTISSCFYNSPVRIRARDVCMRTPCLFCLE